MQIYSYSIPESDFYHTSIPIYNKDNQVISILKKNRHRFLTQLFHMLLRYGMPYCYNAFSIDNHPIYKIDCIFTGVRYTLYSCSTMDKVSITQNRVQLIEKVQSFMLNGDVYQFEKDYTSSGTLTLNGEKIAVIRNLDNTNTNLTNRIDIEAINDDIASLIAIMYQTFV
ncbi:tubby C-terminal domain-like protein [Lysinibacillus sp. NPDC097214]|uniref:tubby C-terminal domain-like protein n=1 Tax=Lysinibacillus sp. NPDC097214 TaxID=3390584 RepID=UPI003D052935